jgi:hypothetical protein
VQLLGKLFRKMSTSKRAIKPKQNLVNMCLNRVPPPVPPRSRADTMSTVNTKQETHVQPMQIDSDNDDGAQQPRNSEFVVLDKDDVSKPLIIDADDSELRSLLDTEGKSQRAL